MAALGSNGLCLIDFSKTYGVVIGLVSPSFHLVLSNITFSTDLTCQKDHDSHLGGTSLLKFLIAGLGDTQFLGREECCGEP